ncbi:MAG: sigma-54 dependent transcriptional regulator [Desulfobulbaceae bacterium]|nr:sigma-54 dependent transcriptional regulator [Desulfobulbaceae bacterium]
MKNYNIIAIDDELNFLKSIKRGLSISGFRNVLTEEDSYKALSLINRKESPIDVALIDISMPGMNGVELLEQIKKISPDTKCLMITGINDAELAVTCIKKGASDYILKPITAKDLVGAVKKTLKKKKLLDSMKENRRSSTGNLKRPEAFRDIITSSSRMFDILQKAELHAASDIPIIITGESGTGKDLLAQAIHKTSPRVKFPYTPVNMTSLTENIFDAEFFGHTKGAFTGAIRERKGYLEQTNHGTIFMDEIGHAPLAFQAKLLRVLQDGEYIKLGTSQPRQVDIRFITATNENLDQLLDKGLFRKDFYYRLNGAKLHLPPLRKRKKDIPLLIKNFLVQFSGTGTLLEIDEQVLSILLEYDYPGNIRELKSIVQSSINLAQGQVITVPCLPHSLQKFKPQKNKHNKKQTKVNVSSLSGVEKNHIIATYNATGRNKTQTARLLRIGLNTLRRKLMAYGVE